jgi:hypothetical protein
MLVLYGQCSLSIKNQNGCARRLGPSSAGNGRVGENLRAPGLCGGFSLWWGLPCEVHGVNTTIGYPNDSHSSLLFHTSERTLLCLEAFEEGREDTVRILLKSGMIDIFQAGLEMGISGWLKTPITVN